MLKAHLSKSQRALVRKFLKSHSQRPTFKEYQSYCKEMALLKPSGKKPTCKTAQNLKPGFEKNEVKLCTGFNAYVDLPEGWAVFSRYDSGGNHGISDAGYIVLCNLWNFWNSTDGTKLSTKEINFCLMKACR